MKEGRREGVKEGRSEGVKECRHEVVSRRVGVGAGFPRPELGNYFHAWLCTKVHVDARSAAWSRVGLS